jgi:hypothetical protein
MAERLKNLILPEQRVRLPYKLPGAGGRGPNIPVRANRVTHAQRLERQFTDAWKSIEESKAADATVTSVADANGTYLQIKGKAGYDLITKSLEDVRQGVRLISVKSEGEDKTIVATVFIPANKRDFFLKKINKYASQETGIDAIAAVENIQIAVAESLWTSEKSHMPTDEPIWCEVWLRHEKKADAGQVKSSFIEVCSSRNIPMKMNSIHFPERIVMGIYANRNTLLSLLLLSPSLAEFRTMKAPTSFFDELTAQEQNEWIDELRGRIDTTNRSDTSICILDTGVNNGHPLLSEFLADEDVSAVDPSHGTNDNHGHGTKMAGITVFHNLEEQLAATTPVAIKHFIESVKILNQEGAENDKDLYGNITQQAVSLAEINHPKAKRSICMAVTASNDELERAGEPSTWSGAVDALISGAEEEGQQKRLMFVSAGNTTIPEIVESGGYKTAVINHSVEDPGQAWNCITVGAYTEKDELFDTTMRDNYSPLVEGGSLSPFSSSSIGWAKQWPIKPEILCEGGNLAVSNDDPNFYSETADFQLLTTSKDFLTGRPFELISMTSSATAQASWISANILDQYPDLWPETIRALMIHSASWTQRMIDAERITNKSNRSDYRRLLRTCGYGVPNLDRAIWSASNCVNMIIQDELQPYQKKESSVTLNEMHIHDIPWPTDILLELEEAPVKMKVTLSFYIEPGPERIGWKDKYRYPSCGLRFDVNNQGEDDNTFIKRISKAMRDEEETGTYSNDSVRWQLGSQNRRAGSILSDTIESTAAELAENNKIVIYPVSGWWKTRSYLGRCDSKIRYSLVVSIEAPEIETDLYTAIQAQIRTRIPITTEVTAI